MMFERGRNWRGGRGGGRQNWDDGGGMRSSPQGGGCFPFFNKNRKKYNVNNNFRDQRGTMSNVAARLGLPVRNHRGLKQQSRGRGRMPFPNRQQTGPKWHKIVIPFGKTLGKEFIMDNLGSYVDGDIYPLLFKYNELGEATFFLEDKDAAESVEAANRRISGPNGKPIQIRRYAVDPPFVPVDNEEADLIKVVLSSRYDAANRHLNLSGFALDPVFKSNQKHCSLQRNNVTVVIVKLIGENCPDVRSIDFSNNRLRYLDYIGALVYRAKQVHRISLSKNQIEMVAELEKLKGWSIVEIDLDQNPLCTRFRDKTSYISAIHKVFPKVRLLDGVAVQPELRFELEDDVPKVEKKTLPKFSPGFYVNDDLRKLVETFVMEYFQLYDGQDPTSSRQKLFQAYDEGAVFTLTIEQIDLKGRYSDRETFMEYRRDSHNIKQIERWERYRQKLVSKGAINVISRLTRLPKTTHLMQSFMVDVSFAADNVMCFTVQGLFRDGELAGTESKELKFFARTFLVIPKGEGKIAVVNDELFITPFSPDQIEQYQKMLQKATAPAVPVDPQPGPSTLVPTLPPNPSMTRSASAGAIVESRESLVQRFAAVSGMKKEWAEKCLEDNDWSYDSAAQVFLQMKEQGLIPAEAFQ